VNISESTGSSNKDTSAVSQGIVPKRKKKKKRRRRKKERKRRKEEGERKKEKEEKETERKKKNGKKVIRVGRYHGGAPEAHQRRDR
jgi:hypothetical protein